MNEQELQAIEERANAATPGPWEPGVLSVPSDSVVSVSENRYVCSVGNGGYWQADAAFIAHARADVPALIAEIRSLRANLDAVPVEAIAKVHRQIAGYYVVGPVADADAAVREWLATQGVQP